MSAPSWMRASDASGCMKSLKGSRTEKNILTAFAGESQARNRYTYFASKAKKEGYEQIAALFLETADQEKEHAKRLFKFLEGGEVEFTAAFPAGVIGTTVENLLAAAAGESYEENEMYPGFAAVAREEGYPEAAVVMPGMTSWMLTFIVAFCLPSPGFARAPVSRKCADRQGGSVRFKL